jgi:hypothetical protein
MKRSSNTPTDPATSWVGEGSVQKQVIGNAVAALLFMAIAIVDFTRDTSGIGAVFLVFAAVFVGLAIAGARKKQ